MMMLDYTHKNCSTRNCNSNSNSNRNNTSDQSPLRIIMQFFFVAAAALAALVNASDEGLRGAKSVSERVINDADPREVKNNKGRIPEKVDLKELEVLESWGRDCGINSDPWCKLVREMLSDYGLGRHA